VGIGTVCIPPAGESSGASRFSIGLVIVSGMSIGTLFTIFVLPVVYTYIGADHRPMRGAKRAAELAEVS
jgi:multidrug efflux pump